MGSLALAAWLVPALAGAVRVEGNSSCPASASVQTRVARLVAAGTPAHLARVDVSGDELHLELRAEDGRLMAWKVLPNEGSCEGLAQVAAVVIAAWEAQFRDGTLFLPHQERVSPSGPVPADEPAAAPAPLPVPVQVAVVPITPEPPPTAAPLEPRVDLAGSFGFSGRWSGGGLLRGSLGRGRWAAVAFVQLEQARQLSLGDGMMRWNRPLAGAGLRFLALEGRPRVELEGGAAIALLLLRGGGFEANASATAADPTAYGAVTLSVDAGAVRPFLGVLGSGFLRDQRASITLPPSEQGPTRPLPRGAVTVYVGVGWPARAP